MPVRRETLPSGAINEWWEPDPPKMWDAPGIMSQNWYKQQAEAGVGTADWGGIQPFLWDWATKGGRGITGGQGGQASWEQVLADLEARGYDWRAAGLPEHLPAARPSAQQSAALPADVANLFATRRSNAQAQYQALLAQLAQQEGMGRQNQDESLRRFGTETFQQRGNLPGEFIGRGIYNSGIWRQALGDFTSGRVRGENDIRSQYAQLLQSIGAQRGTAAVDLNTNLSQISAEEEAAKAQRVADLRAQGLVS